MASQAVSASQMAMVGDADDDGVVKPHQPFLQALLFNSPMPEKDVQRIFQQAHAQHQPAEGEEAPDLREFVQQCNDKLKQVAMTINHCTDEVTGDTVYALVNTRVDLAARTYATRLDKFTLSLFNALVEEILSGDGFVNDKDAWQLGRRLELGTAKSAKQTYLQIVSPPFTLRRCRLG
ncbi:hypothetical protein PTSG_10009 [Salpingoeca rosetta]|uniref:Non-structural maintenance of chromosomes element 1 homolog n=1 Tax=Salpingoeca rosetta (strain ATCC 50818 / BSB-021) TaxID=946362 RepID=F2UP90_SALR5|nr:uncharacterized protein PTSG_10009 [Salpingoeca rosetta]EGD79445.1 hypothetical protein PTSG_10009 [Salpingoeca rosetta]|eukprot:XP_004988926.1 hypothetical protein PTSG_10009 [Salpingoeca rosetta]